MLFFSLLYLIFNCSNAVFNTVLPRLPMNQKPKNLLTRQGFNALADEHEKLAKIERPKMVEGVATAAAEGDRSENAEYIYGKKKLREIDRRLRYLNSLLKDAQVVDPTTLKGDTVCFASTVVIRNEHGEIKEWMIVGKGEPNFDGKRISAESPVGKALLGKKVGDIVSVDRPAGETELEIMELKFSK